MGDSSTTIVIAVLGSAGLGAIIAAVVNGFFSKRKLGAEATEIITKAAAGVVTNLEAENLRQSAAMAKMVVDHAALIAEMKLKMDAQTASHALEIEEFKRVLQLHVAWDTIAIAKLNEVKIHLPPAPPLLPARRFDHPEA
jgi:hypothetical protein